VSFVPTTRREDRDSLACSRSSPCCRAELIQRGTKSPAPLAASPLWRLEASPSRSQRRLACLIVLALEPLDQFLCRRRRPFLSIGDRASRQKSDGQDPKANGT
jgi:hypothetical protein